MTVCNLIPLVRHTLIHSGTSMLHHYVYIKGCFAQTRQLCTDWSLAICFLVGFTIFYKDPAAKSSFEKAHERTAFKARLLRFTTLQLRNWQLSSIMYHGLAKFGVLRLSCKVA